MDGDIFARDGEREGRKGKEKGGRGGGKVSAFFPVRISPLFFTPSSPSVFRVLSASVAASCFLFAIDIFLPLFSSPSVPMKLTTV